MGLPFCDYLKGGIVFLKIFNQYQALSIMQNVWRNKNINKI